MTTEPAERLDEPFTGYLDMIVSRYREAAALESDFKATPLTYLDIKNRDNYLRWREQMYMRSIGGQPLEKPSMLHGVRLQVLEYLSRLSLDRFP